MPPRDPSLATRLLNRLNQGDREAADQLLSLIYDELKGLAERSMRDQKPAHTLQPTALVHEAWMKLCDRDDVRWESRGHFLRVAASAMRSVLVDHARAKLADKRGGGRAALPLDGVLALAEERGIDVLALDEALGKLAEVDPELAQIVELRFFSGMTIEDVAAELGVSGRTVDRAWRVARAWLRREIRPDDGS